MRVVWIVPMRYEKRDYKEPVEADIRVWVVPMKHEKEDFGQKEGSRQFKDISVLKNRFK